MSESAGEAGGLAELWGGTERGRVLDEARRLEDRSEPRESSARAFYVLLAKQPSTESAGAFRVLLTKRRFTE
ncbi:hypothetical protein BRC81_09110 [Halobacteriales archaeon QS_1_68_20]|nr:MAG: hypothetical protein BRC81_09110 [Halobacteriales archaeon QS_1_68_20]